MADKSAQYWDVEQCAWVRFVTPQLAVEVPVQPTAVEDDQEADVRSG